MAKKKLGKFVALAAAAAAVAAGISYFLKYREFHQELEKDFQEFEEDNPEEDFDHASAPEQPAGRNYVSLNPSSESAPAKDPESAPVKDQDAASGETVANPAEDAAETVTDEKEKPSASPDAEAPGSSMASNSTTTVEEEV